MNNATQTDVTGLKWFKIYQDGLDTSTNTWGVDRLIANAGKVSFKIPSCIEAGQYLLRHELIGELKLRTVPGDHADLAVRSPPRRWFIPRSTTLCDYIVDFPHLQLADAHG